MFVFMGYLIVRRVVPFRVRMGMLVDLVSVPMRVGMNDDLWRITAPQAVLGAYLACSPAFRAFFRHC